MLNTNANFSKKELYTRETSFVRRNFISVLEFTSINKTRPKTGFGTLEPEVYIGCISFYI